MSRQRQISMSFMVLALSSAVLATSGSASPATFPGAAGKIVLSSRGFGSLEDGMRTAAGANGNLEELIALHQEKLIEDTGTLYRKTTS